ncbi:hypothetical protein BDR07DRAFT_1467937 [Suillus spraguei]|nr:hypothetical protein BDR07DRAFT_1467937 [Suillus spraguei]
MFKLNPYKVYYALFTFIPLSTFPLPLSPSGPPPGYGWEDRDMSTFSGTSGFTTGINARDKFFGRARCVICGCACHIIIDSDEEIWCKLKTLNWIPQQAKSTPRHELRDGLLMCGNHQRVYDRYYFFIRFFPDASSISSFTREQIRKFVFINFSGDEELQQFHGKAVALDIRDHHAPFPSTFIIHEMRVRGYHPFQPIALAMPDDIPWQDWVLSDGVFNNNAGTFNRDSPTDNNNQSVPQLQFQPTTTSIGDTSSGPGTCTLALNADVISDILTATHAMPSWRACQMEGTSWSGTAEENKISRNMSLPLMH